MIPIQRTKNIKFCAFLKIKDINPVKVEMISRGKGIFFFEIENHVWESLKMDFTSSPYLVYANALEAIKDLCY